MLNNLEGIGGGEIIMQNNLEEDLFKTLSMSRSLLREQEEFLEEEEEIGTVSFEQINLWR